MSAVTSEAPARERPGFVRSAIPVDVRRTVTESADMRCHYCNRLGGRVLDPDARKWHIDHKLPVSKGGTNELANLVLACKRCNLKKGVREYADFAAYARREFWEEDGQIPFSVIDSLVESLRVFAGDGLAMIDDAGVAAKRIADRAAIEHGHGMSATCAIAVYPSGDSRQYEPIAVVHQGGIGESMNSRGDALVNFLIVASAHLPALLEMARAQIQHQRDEARHG